MEHYVAIDNVCAWPITPHPVVGINAQRSEFDYRIGAQLVGLDPAGRRRVVDCHGYQFCR